MSKTTKLHALRDGGSEPLVLFREPVEGYTEPVLLTTIDDESLPHPGDGKEWEESEDWMPAPQPVEIHGLPHEDADGSVWVAVIDEDGDLCLVRVEYLRERKPEPEHEKWCRKPRCNAWTQYVCTCERRSGEERRKGERREDWPHWVAVVDRRRQESLVGGRGRRSGTDRRQSP